MFKASGFWRLAFIISCVLACLGVFSLYGLMVVSAQNGAPFSLPGKGGYPTITEFFTSTGTATLTPFLPADQTPTPTPPLTPTVTLTPTPTPTDTPTVTPTNTATPLPTDTPEPPPPDDGIPSEAFIEGVYGQPQRFTLDCEARSATDLAAFWGFYFDEMDFLNRLPLSDDPNQGFVGYYWDERGQLPPRSYGVYADPIARLLREYGLSAESIYGMNYEDMLREVAAGRPVMVWVIGNTWAGQPTTYTMPNGDTIPVVNFEHTAIVVGYDDVDILLLDGDILYRRSIPVFQNSWAALGNIAVVVR